MSLIFKFGEEEIKQLKEFPNYGVSNLGYVYKDIKYGLLPETYTKKRLKGYRDPKGFIKVHLSEGKKQKIYFVHRLVAQYFVPNPEGYRYVKHKDGNKENNRYDNLIWIPVLKKKKIDDGLYNQLLKLKEEGYSLKEISEKTGLSYSYVTNILSRYTQITVRIPENLKEKLQKKASREKKSISNLIIDILRKELSE
ncbi:HNH endonuclease [Persephonella sp.]